MRRTILATFMVTALLLVGCSSDDSTAAAPPEPTSDQSIESEEEPSSETDSEPEGSQAPEAPEEETQAETDAAAEADLSLLSPEMIVDGLSTSNLPVEAVEVFDAETDPNGLLGRPGQYTVKVSWEDSRLTEALNATGTIEVFPDVESMQGRADYVEQIGQESPMLLQWVFTNPQTGAVLRVPSDLTPDQAAEYEAWLLSLG